MRNVVPTRVLARRSRRLLEFALLAISAGVFFALIGLAFYIVPLFGPGNVLYTVFNLVRIVLLGGGILLGLAGLGMVARALTWKTENDLARQAGEALAEHFDERFTFIRNVSKRKLGYIDAVLAGPPGILALRIVDYEGRFLNEAGKWLKANPKGAWKPFSPNMTQQVVEDVKNLREYLAGRNLPNTPVFGVVVFTKDDPIAHLTVKDPVVIATHLSSLPIRLKPNYLSQDRMTPQAVAAVVRLLYGE